MRHSGVGLRAGLMMWAATALSMALVCPAVSEAASAADERPSFTVSPGDSLPPRFAKAKHDYAVRCLPHETVLHVEGASGWRARVGHGPFRPGSFDQKLHANSEKAVSVGFRKAGGGGRSAYYVRCLPGDFPEYSFRRDAPGGPGLFSLQLGSRYAAIFDRNGVPIYWYVASGEPDNFQVLPDGTIAFDPVDVLSFQTGDYEVRTLTGRLLRVVSGAAGAAADIHEIQLLPNGNYLIGAQVNYSGVDTTPYGGSANSTVTGIQIQELTPDGDLVWSWDSRDHIGLEETGRWWDTPALDNQPYDVVHWNSAEVVGKHRLLLSFRHLDAVYEIDRRTGEIIWKLGGTETPESLEVTNDPHGDFPLGGQHDARLLPNGTITIHDNRTGLGDPPRAVRFRIDAENGTARLVQSVQDPRSHHHSAAAPRAGWAPANG